MSTHMACAPTGPKVGEACSFTADPAGAYDDCGDGLLCILGVCERFCTEQECAGHRCDYLAGQPPEMRQCPLAWPSR